MNEHSNPIEFLIDFAWANGADRFVVNNAKQELQKLKEDSKNSERWLSCEKDLAKTRQENKDIKQIFENPVAFGKLNERLDLYDLRLYYNQYDNQTKVVPLYSNREEFLTEDWKKHNGKPT